MAFPVTLNGRTYTLTDFEGTNYVDGLPDAFEDFVTHAGDIYNSTSTTSNSIGTGSKTFTVEANKPYQAGTPLRIADAAAPSTNFLDTVVTSYSGTTLVVNSIGFGGSGTKTSWTVNIGGAKTVDGTLGLSQGGTGATDAAGARTNIDVYSKSEADTRYLNISGDSADISFGANMSFGDSNKIIMGAGSDLEIYHDGNSKIVDVGGGKLELQSDGTGVTIQKGATEYMAQFLTDGAVTLYYDNAVKIATTATGAQIQSTADQNLNLLTTGSNADNRINFGDSDDTDIGRIYYQHNGNHMLFYTNAQERIKISGEGHVGIGSGSTDSLTARTAQGYLSTRVNNFNITSGSSAYAFTGVNIYQDSAGAYKYIDSAASTSIHYWGSAIQFHVAPSGTADATGASNEKMRLDADGLKFNGDTAAANALDDYETGYFEPNIQPTSGSITWNTDQNKLSYTKIGRLVHITGQLAVSSVSSPSGITRGSLPFTLLDQDEQSERTTGVALVSNTSLNVNDFGMYPNGGSDTFLEIIRTNATSIQRDAGSYFNSSTVIQINYTYVAA